MTDENKRGRRSRSEWEKMNAHELTKLMAHRIARIEILKLEIEELQKLIRDRRMK